MTEKTYTLEELDAIDSEALDAETADTYSLDDLDRLDSWSAGKNVFQEAAVSFGKGIAADIVRIPDEIGHLIKETGEKGGAGLAIPSFIDGVNIARKLTGKEIERGKQDEFLIKAGEMLSEKTKGFIGRINLEPEEGSRLSQVAFDLGSGASSLATSLGLLYTTRSPSLLFGLFGARQKAQIYEESRAAGLDPEEASIASSAAGLVEGGIEAMGGLAFLKSASFNKFLTKALIRVSEQGLEEGLQQSGEEAITKFSGVRRDSLNDSLLRIGYAATLGVILGAPAATITGAIEKTQIKSELRAAGLTSDQANAVIERVTARTIKDQTVKQEIAAFLEEEIAATEKALNENPQVKKPESEGDDSTEDASEQEVKTKETEEKSGESPKSTEDISAKLESEVQAIQKKIESYKKAGKPVPESLIKRQDALSYERKGLGDVAAEVMKFVAFEGKEEVKPNRDLKKVIREKTGQIDVAPKKVTEMQALKESLRAQARAALQSERATKSDLKALKQGIVDTIKEIVPTDGRGKFLNMVATAESGRDIIGVMNRVEKVADEIQRKDLVSAIKKQVKRIKASKSIAIDYVQKIQDFVNNFDLKDRASDTVISLLETQRFIEEKRRQGEDVSLPQYMVNKLQILEKQPLGAINTGTLQNILSDIQRLADIGKTKLRARQAFEESRKSQALAELLAGSKPINEKQIIEPTIGEELKVEQVRKNALHKAMNAAQSLDLSITPMDVIFDTLDGNKGYTGPNYRIFKKAIDQAYSEYLNKKDAIARDIVNLANDLGLEDGQFERIGFFAAKMQEGGMEKLEALGYSPQEIDSVKLTEKEETLYMAMRRKLDSLRPEIAEVMRTVYNEELGTVANYFPFMTDFEEMSDLEIRERFGNNVQEFGQAPRKNVEKGFTKKRVGGKQKIKLHAMEIFLRHIDNAAYLVTVGQETKRLGEIAKSEEYREAVGDKGREIVLDWVDTVARKGKMAGERSNALDALRKNVGMATLGFKLSSVLLQPTALMDGASLVGREVFEGSKLIATNKSWRQFVSDHMPEVRARIGDDPAYIEFGSNSFMDKTGRTAFWALQKMDSLTASSVAAGAYLKFMRSEGLDVDLENPNAAALDYAQLMVRRTQASAFFKDAPQAVTRGKLTGNRQIDRLILQFQTFMINRWSLIKHDGFSLGFKSGNIAQGLNVMTFLVLANIAEIGFRGLSKELVDLITGSDSADDDGFSEELFINLLETVPGVSQLVSAVSYGSVPVPSFQFVRKAFDRLQAFSRSKEDDTKAKNAARALTLLSGLLGVPGTVQAEQVIGNIGKDSKRRGA